MSSSYHCRRGVAHRDLIRRSILVRLAVGDRLPTTARLGLWLGLSQRQAWRQLRRALDEAGIATERRGKPPRIYVIDIPTMRAAA